MAANQSLYAAYLEKNLKTGRALAIAGVLCCLLACAGCSGSLEKAASTVLSGPRIDWGMSLLAGNGNGIGQFPAKFTFDINAAPDCTNDFVAYNTSSNTPGVAKIIAYNSLYATQGTAGGLCGTDGPSVYWAYDTSVGTAAAALTSPILSLDGSKIAYVENYGSGIVRILKWKAGQGTSMSAPATPDHDISGTAWSTCPVNTSCVQSIAFSGGTNDTKSPPFYNYSTDVLYVGDNSGGLHKFTGVFNGTPAEVIGGGWPLEVDSGAVLTGPVFDSTSGNIYVDDSNGNLSEIREVGSTAGTCTAPCVNAQFGFGITPDEPIVNGTNEQVFVIAGDSMGDTHFIEAPVGNFNGYGGISVGDSNAMDQGSNLYHGAFDNTYLNSSVPNVAGHMYVCGKDSSNDDRPALYQISFNANGTLQPFPPALVGLAQGDGEACSPVTEVYNSGTSKDWIFFSIGNNVNTGGAPIPAGSCASTGAGCVIGIDVTGGPSWPPANVNNTASVPANNAGATSGIIVDNVSTASQASNIYFSLGGNSTGAGPGLPSCNTTAGVGCAVKLTQSTLQ